MAYLVVTLTGDEAKLFRAQQKIIQQQLEEAKNDCQENCQENCRVIHGARCDLISVDRQTTTENYTCDLRIDTKHLFRYLISSLSQPKSL